MSLKDEIWLPTLTPDELKTFKILETTKSLEKLILTSDPDHRLFYQTTILVTFGCSMDFDDFPFDSHRCLFQVN